MNDTVVETYGIGRLYIRAFRNLLEELRFLGEDISWHEGKGWTYKEFLVRCSPELHRAIVETLRKHLAEVA